MRIWYTIYQYWSGMSTPMINWCSITIVVTFAKDVVFILSPFQWPFSRWTRVSWCLLKQRMMEVVVTTGLLELKVVQSSRQIITTNKPTSSFFTGRMPFLSPNQQCQSTEGKNITFHGLAYPSSPGGLPTLSLTTNSSWLCWGMVAMPLISPLMPVPLFSLVYPKFSNEFHKMQWKVALRPWKKQLDFGSRVT